MWRKVCDEFIECCLEGAPDHSCQEVLENHDVEMAGTNVGMHHQSRKIWKKCLLTEMLLILTRTYFK